MDLELSEHLSKKKKERLLTYLMKQKLEHFKSLELRKKFHQYR